MICVALIVGCFLLQAQDAPKTNSDQAKSSSDQKSGKSAATTEETQSSPSSGTQQGQAEDNPLNRKRPSTKAAKIEKMGQVYKKWLDEDVRWIITDEELSAFKKLSNNAERDSFIEHFWQRRDPTPDTSENEFKEEHYRRLAYADEHFAAGIRGRNTDRGRIYVMYGKPDSIDSHPMGGPYQRPAEEGGGETETYPFEVWTYRNLEGIGQQIELEFVDSCSCGDYHLTIDPGEKDALSKIPGAGSTLLESWGMANKADRLRGGLDTSGASLFDSGRQARQFEKQETLAKMYAPPPVRYRTLKEDVHSFIRY